MKSVKQKREQLMKQIRSKQRNEKISQNRQKLFASYQDESLVSLIFLMIDKDGQEISAESFDDFLEIISDEMLGASEEENKINEGITHAILQRYRGLLSQFQQRVNSCDPFKRIALVYQNRKAFDLIRFLIRLQYIEKPHLNVLDSLLESTDIKLKQLIDRSVQIQCNSFQENHIQTMDEFIMIFQMRLKILKQLAYLYFLSAQTKNQGNEKTRLRKAQREMIFSLTEKWIENYLLLDFLFLPSFMYFIRKSHQHWQKLQQLIKKHQHLYLQFLVQHNEVLLKIINSQDIIKNPKKISQLVLMLFSLSKKKKKNVEIEITQYHHNSLDESLILFMDLGIKIIKSIQAKISDCGQINSLIKKTHSQFLKCLIDSFIQDPFEVLRTFLTNIQLTQRDYFIQSVSLMNKGNEKQPHPVIVTLLHSIQELEYCDLVNFVELLSIIVSYNQTAIDILFKAPMFQGYYDQQLNFQTLLESKLLRHVSGEVRRRAAWLLSNITGSEEFYFYGLGFIKNFYLSNILQEDCSHELTKQEALIKQSILQAIMNYLSNLRRFKEVEEMIGFSMKNQKEDAQFQVYKGEKSNNFVNSSNNQSLFIWTIRTLGSVIQNLSTNSVILKNTQKFIEVLIYSLYNLLTLQQNEEQRSEENPPIVLSIMQAYGIPKNLETIYHNAETTNQYSRFFTMIQTLLDLIEKVKNEN